jgi:hypothetical protein
MNKLSDQFTGYNYSIIERPYYGSFLYKISFRGASVFGNKLSAAKIAELQRFRSLHWQIRTRAKEICGSTGFRFRQDNTLNIYCKDTNHARDLIAEYEDYIYEIFGPRDDDHRAQALIEPKILVKHRLWKGRFRFRLNLELEQVDMAAFNNIMVDLVFGIDYHANQNLHDLMVMEVPEFWNWYSGDKILYCNDEGLIMMIGLVCTDAIQKIDKVITHNELSEQKKITTKDVRA